jgi:hypothetical protein
VINNNNNNNNNSFVFAYCFIRKPNPKSGMLCCENSIDLPQIQTCLQARKLPVFRVTCCNTVCHKICLNLLTCEIFIVWTRNTAFVVEIHNDVLGCGDCKSLHS